MNGSTGSKTITIHQKQSVSSDLQRMQSFYQGTKHVRESEEKRELGSLAQTENRGTKTKKNRESFNPNNSLSFHNLSLLGYASQNNIMHHKTT